MTGDFFRAGRDALTRILQEHKAAGCQVLLVGDVPDEVTNRNSQRLLGNPGATPPRKRIFGLAGRPPSLVDQRVPNESDYPLDQNTAIEIVHGPSTGRGAATSHSNPSSPTTDGSGQLETTATEPAISPEDFTTALDAAASRLLPQDREEFNASELRVCIDNLDAFETTTARRDVIDSVQRTLVDTHNAMVHHVYTTPYDADAVRELHDVVDIILEYRVGAPGVEQRFVAPAEDFETEWWVK